MAGDVQNVPEQSAYVDGQQPRALVVDDSAVIRELIAVNLELEGFLVTCASDGEAALRAVREVVPHVITLDVVMPRLDGLATVRRLRADPATSDIPIVIVSGRATAADVEKGRDAGADVYLTKPFEPSELVEVCRRLAEESRSRPGAND
jgi:DNA-binding response OmpR family regulator